MKGLNLLFAFLGGSCRVCRRNSVCSEKGVDTERAFVNYFTTKESIKRRYGTLGRPNCRRGKRAGSNSSKMKMRISKRTGSYL